MNQLAKLGHGILFAFHQRGSGKAYIACIGEHAAHLGRHETIVGAMAFIHKNKDITGVVLGFLTLCGIEFVDNTGDYVCFCTVDQLHQMPSAGRTGRIQPCMGEGRCNLSVQFLPVGYDDNTGMTSCQLHQDILRQHDHGQALAAALRMPDHAALPVAFLVVLGNRLHNLFDGKILLIAADLFHIGIKENKIADQLKNSLLAEQGDDVFVLLRWHAVGDKPCQLPVHESFILLFPDVPELLGRTGSGIFHGILVGCQNDLRIFEKLRDIVCLLVADHLLHGLIYGNLRCLTFNNGKRNTVDEQHDIGTSIMLLVPTVHGELFRHMEHVILRILPVNVFQVEVEHSAFADGFRITFAQQQRIIDFFAGTHKAVGQRLVQILHGSLDVCGGEFIFRTGIRITVELAELPTQNVLQQHMISTAPLLFAVLRRDVYVTHGLKKPDSRFLACVDFQIGVFIHGTASFRESIKKHE